MFSLLLLLLAFLLMLALPLLLGLHLLIELRLNIGLIRRALVLRIEGTLFVALGELRRGYDRWSLLTLYPRAICAALVVAIGTCG
ncbi:hypothetical protein [Shewanella sp. cp20]|uniref:hypothetical protein n=1 Tax=Shewanella sp. cp20 TaxID=1521167 RepID=UPI003FA7D338